MGLHDPRRSLLRMLRPMSRRTTAAAKKVVQAVDVWIQDHCIVVGVCLLVTSVVSTGLLLLWKWAEAITLAKQLAPVLTIVSITVTTLFGLMKWFRNRRNKRLDGLGDRA